VENEYATKYLEMMGARPTKDNLSRIIKHFPLKEAFVYPNWMNDTLIVIPGMADYTKASNNQVVTKDGFGRFELFCLCFRRISCSSQMLIVLTTS
jgi:hypothetical protein